jgi:acetoin utilization deacetylase AcuC-like enzyme
MAASTSQTGTGLILDERVMRHDTGPGHPETAERFASIRRFLQAEGLVEQARIVKPREATHEELRLVHSDEYLHQVEEDLQMNHHELSTGDTVISPASGLVARLAAGGILNAVDHVMTGDLRRVFCVVRPPGHHATPNRGMGFCIYNNIALAAAYARQKHGLERVAIFDWDVHHGNGTQDAFYDEPAVFFSSMHQFPWYPGSGAADETGSGPGEGYTLNLPMPANSSGQEILSEIQTKLLPRLEEFAPQLVLVSAGFDSRLGDPLGHLKLTDDDFATLTRWMRDVARKYAQGRVLSVLEGGYDLEGLGKAAQAHFRAMLEPEPAGE